MGATVAGIRASVVGMVVFVGEGAVLVEGVRFTVKSHAKDTTISIDRNKKSFFMVAFPFILNDSHLEYKTPPSPGESWTGQVDSLFLQGHRVSQLSMQPSGPSHAIGMRIDQSKNEVQRLDHAGTFLLRTNVLVFQMIVMPSAATNHKAMDKASARSLSAINSPVKLTME